MDAAQTEAERWFAQRGWVPFDFQRAVWTAMAEGRSALLPRSKIAPEPARQLPSLLRYAAYSS